MTNEVLPTERPRFVAIVIAIIIGSICALVVNTLPVFLTVLARARDLSGAQSGLSAMADTGGIAIGTIGVALLPALVERLNWRRTAASGLAIMIVANLLAIVVEAFIPYLFVRVFAGMGAGIAMAIVYAVLAEGDGARDLALFNIAQLGAGWLGIPFLSPIAEAHGVGGLFGIIAILAACALVLALFLLPKMSTKIAEKPDEDDLKDEKVSGRGWLAILSVLLYFASAGAVFAYLAFMGMAWGASAASVEHDVSIILLSAMAGGAVVAVIGSRFGFRGPLILGYVGLLVSMALFFLIKPVGAFLLVGCLFGFSWNILTPFQFEAVTKVDPSSSAAMLVNAGTLGGMAIGPAVAGYLISGDYATVNAAAFVVCSLSAILVLIALRLKRIGQRSDQWAQ